MPSYGVRGSSDEDGLVVAWFSVEFQGAIAGVFRECTGMGSNHDVIEHKGVSSKGMQIVNKIPGNLKFNPIVLKRGVTDSTDFWTWFENAAVKGQVKENRKSGTITMYNAEHEPLAKWDLQNVFPTKISGPAFDASSTNVAVEEMTLVCEDYHRTQ